MAEDTGTISFADAVSMAIQEVDAATTGDLAPDIVADVADDAPASDEGQAESDTEAVESVFDVLVEDEGADVTAPLLDQTVDVPGFDEPVSVAELRDGYLRQADYTRKTQELADQRKALETDGEASSLLMEKLRENPQATIAALAVEVGLLNERDLPSNVGDSPLKFPSEEDFEAEVAKRVEKAVEEHPMVVQAQEQVIIQQIDVEFGAIEEANGVQLSPNDRAMVLEKAVELGTTRLDAAFATLMSEANQKRKQRDAVVAAAPQRPSAGDASEASNDNVAPAKTIRGLFDQVEEGLIT